jgi:hypothetical protein
MLEKRYKYYIEYGPIKDLLDYKLKKIIIECYLKNSKEIKKLLFYYLKQTVISSKIYYKKYEEFEILEDYKIIMNSQYLVKIDELKENNENNFLYNKYALYE